MIGEIKFDTAAASAMNDSSVGDLDLMDDDDDDDDVSLGKRQGGGADGGYNNPDDPYGFLAQQGLLGGDSTSDDSSYWSDSSDEEESDEEEDEDEEKSGDDDHNNDSGVEGNAEGDDDDDSDMSLQHPTDDGQIPTAAAAKLMDKDKKSDARRANRRGPDAVKRNDSSLSLDALLKLQMQLGDKKAPPPKDKTARRRGRRLNQEHTTSLGELAKKVGTSTGNELDESVKEAVQRLKRSESATRIPYRKPKPPVKFQHIQQPQQAPAASPIQQQQMPPNNNNKHYHESYSHGHTTGALDAGTMMDKSTKTVGAVPASMPGGLKRSSIMKYPEHAKNLVSPKDHYLSIVRTTNHMTVPLIPYDDPLLEDFFLPVTAQDKAAFDMELVGAVRDGNLDKVKALKEQGHPLQARSQTGESILHVCARRGTPELLRYLLEHASSDDNQTSQNSCRVCCDYGRTPLHDAAWSRDATSLEMMKILIQTCPDLLLILDKRGFMPLDYIPKDRWPHCCAFLDKYKDIILPTGVLFGDDSSSSSEEGDSDRSLDHGSEDDSEE